MSHHGAMSTPSHVTVQCHMYVCMFVDVSRVDMHAVYLQSVRSPYQRNVAHSRAVSHRGPRSNVYSQPCDSDDGNDDYVNDSFCVDNDFDETQG